MLVDDADVEARNRPPGDPRLSDLIVADQGDVHLGRAVAGAHAHAKAATEVVDVIDERNHEHPLHRVVDVVRLRLLAGEEVGHGAQQE